MTPPVRAPRSTDDGALRPAGQATDDSAPCGPHASACGGLRMITDRLAHRLAEPAASLSTRGTRGNAHYQGDHSY